MNEKTKGLSIMAVISISILAIAFASISGIITASEAGLSQTSNMSSNGSEEAVDQAKIGDILANPAKYVWELVTITGEYRGWQGEGYEPPVTLSDWVIKDETGLIYVTGKSPGLDPVEDIGKKLEVSGMVRVKDDTPYIEAKINKKIELTHEFVEPAIEKIVIGEQEYNTSATTSPSAEPEVRGGAGRVAYNQVENNYEVFSPPSEPISFGIPLAPGEIEIKYDDGGSEGATCATYGYEHAVRFTPPSYPVDLKIARLNLWRELWYTGNFAVVVYDDDGPGGEPGTLLGQVSSIVTESRWYDVDLSGLGITITSGDFYIAHKPLDYPPPTECIGFDTTSPDYRSFKYHDGSWTIHNDRDYMIRCVVDLPLKPDLAITEKWVNWPDNCTICYNVTNIGEGTAPACHNTTLYVEGVEVAHDHVPVDLAPGGSYIGCFDGYDWGYTPPSDNITMCADNNETLDELDETNNCVTNIWMCGDVNGDGKVTMSDVRKVFNRYLDPNYPLDSPWAADVNCDEKVTMSDVRKVFNRYLDPGYELNCCCEEVVMGNMKKISGYMPLTIIIADTNKIFVHKFLYNPTMYWLHRRNARIPKSLYTSSRKPYNCFGKIAK